MTGNATTTTAAARIDPKQLTLKHLLERSKGQIAMALPRHLTAERMIRVAMTCFNRTPGLQDCTPLSIVACVIQASELGLVLSGVLGQAYMVPRFNKNINGMEATFQVGYRGFIDLAYRSGQVEGIPMRVVYTNDNFRYRLGTQQVIDHEPAREGPPPIQDDKLPYPDNVSYVYCVVHIKGCERPDFEVMSTAAIESHRRRYAPNSYAGFSPWQSAAASDEYGEAGVSQVGLLDEHLTKTEQLAAQLEDKVANAQTQETVDGNGAAPTTAQEPAATQAKRPRRTKAEMAAAIQAAAAQVPVVTSPGPRPEATAPPSTPAAPAQPSPMRPAQRSRLDDLENNCPISVFNEAILKQGVDRKSALTEVQAQAVIEELTAFVEGGDPEPEREPGDDGE